MAGPKIKNRTIPSDKVRDPANIELMTYNEKAGARKSTEVGRALLPLPDGAGGYTTNASSAARVMPSAGRNLAIYNNDTTVHAVTVGDSTMAAQSAGAVQTAGSPTAPFVGVACAPGAWTYLAMGEWSYVKTDSANLLVYLIDDDTYIVTQPANNASA